MPAKPAAVKVPKGLGWKLAASLDAPGSGNWQGAVQNRTTGEWFLCEAKVTERNADGSVKREDTIFHRFDPKQRYLDTMVCSGFGHQTGFSVCADGTILCSTGGRVVLVPYVVGWTQPEAAVRLAHPVAGTVQAGLSPTRAWIVIRRIRPTLEEYRLYAFDQKTKTVGKQRGKVITVQRADDRVCQGFGVSNFELRILTGKTNRQTFVERYNFDTRATLAKRDVTDWGITADQTAPKIEAEGLDGSRIGMKWNTGEERRLLILDVDLK